MRKFIVTVMASLLSCSTAFAFWPEAMDSSLEIGVGYRQDKLEWKTKTHFDGDNYCGDCFGFPDHLSSKLEWKNLDIWLIELRGKYVTCDNIYLRASGDYGWITHGKNTDKDDIGFGDCYCDDDVQFACSKSRTRGNVYDAKIAVGYQFRMCDDSFAIAPLFGYSWHGQHFRDRHKNRDEYFNGRPVFFEAARACDDGCSEASFSKYDCYSRCDDHKDHDKYHTRWDGPFIGVDFDYRFGCGCEADWEIFGAYEFHWAEFHGTGHWHKRHDLSHGFHHHARNAYGHVFDIGVKWDFCESWSLALRGEFQWWNAHHGRDRAKIAENACGDFKTDCYAKIPLRDIRWESAAVILDVGMVF